MIFQPYKLLLSMSFSAPTAPPEAETYLPSQTDSFGDGLWHIFKTAIRELTPALSEAAGICLALIAVVLLITILKSFSETTNEIMQYAATISVALLLVQPSNTLIHLGIDTVGKMSDYGKLLLPVMTAALAAEGGITASTALYAGTVIFNTILLTVLSKLIIPMIYIYMTICIANRAIANDMLSNIGKFIKWCMTWLLKLTLYIFTGYMSITGVVSGSADASAIKAAKIAISGAVPVIGNIISDASETIVISAGVMKNSAGVLGLLVVLAIWIGPFLRIAVQYLLLKLTAAVCSAFGHKSVHGLINDFSAIMGFLLAATGTMCLLVLISTVCFMRGIT